MKWNAHLMIFYRPKYAALGNNFADAEDAGEALEAIGCEKLEPVFDISGGVEDCEDVTSATKSSQRPLRPSRKGI